MPQTITRTEFQQAIEQGVSEARIDDALTPEQIEQVRAIGRTAQDVAIGTFYTLPQDGSDERCYCPLMQAGIINEDALGDGSANIPWAFTDAFDGALRAHVRRSHYARITEA